MSEVQDLIDQFANLGPDALKELDKHLLAGTADRHWLPNPGPQTRAYYCEADELLYGGQAGGGKSDLGVGLAIEEHTKSLILRRFTDDAAVLAERTMSVLNSREGFNGQKLQLRLDKKLIDYGGVKDEKSKQRFKGDPHDLIFFDELSDFSKTIYEFIIAWNRSVDPDQRCRVIGATNPPTDVDGLWVIEHWAAWLDPEHPNPAAEGELRWYTTEIDGRDVEVDGPGPHMIGGEEVIARSRTFIRSELADNPDLAITNYDAVLSRLPKEYREAYKDGKFNTRISDNPFQVFPTDWIYSAQQRWRDALPEPPHGVPMCAMGVDIAQGGEDNTVLAPRYDGWFPKPIEIPGKLTPDGKSVAAEVVKHRKHSCHVVIDMGGGYGGAAYEHLSENIDSSELHAHKGAVSSTGKTRDQLQGFFNKRAEVIWKFREAMDPSQYQGSPIFLPPDREIAEEMAKLTFEIVRGEGGNEVVKVLPKKKLVELLGRSPDKSDAIFQAWSKGAKAATHVQEWRDDQRVGRIGRIKLPVVNLGPRHVGVNRRR